jgi:hypothetical protein
MGRCGSMCGRYGRAVVSCELVVVSKGKSKGKSKGNGKGKGKGKG